ncbi:c-type cytochrome domain-containing protein [Blastopirellula marina]|uniref:WD40 repeat protein n=1 Tax=Blastopirellula marina DSM 3645 TaxID=314230 RepID=A3ZR51_9BACT|nr:c-type cytochrome domain-containing protein [Blastopirellula marina]EAQ81144.1 WD40 repeat protein [Blastopirellula marina DSM 3645]
MKKIYTTAMLLLVAAPLAAQEKPASPKITYDDHVRAIFREHCFSCHNQSDAKGGLALDSFGKSMEGGSSGEVIVAQDIESSRLWDLVAHIDTPAMPPNQDKLPQPKLDLIKAWIEMGALENSGSTAKKSNKPSLKMAGPTTTGKPEGPAAMPENVWREPIVYTDRAAAVSSIATSPWAPLAAVAGQKQISLYNTDNGQLLGILPYPEGIAYILRFSRNGELLLAGGGRGAHSGTVVLYEVRTGKRLMKLGDELDVVLAADINPSLTRVALGGPQKIIRIYSTEDGSLLHEIKKHTDWVTALEYSPDGVLLASGDRANGLFVWEADAAQEYLNLQGHKAAITAVSWRGDSNVLASASEDSAVKLWEMNEGKTIKSFNAHGGGTECVRFGQDGRLATAGRDRFAKVFSGDGKEEKKSPACDDIALEAVLTYDGKRLIAGDWNGIVRMWDLEKMEEVAQLPPNPPTYEMQIATQQTAQTAAKAKADEAATQLAAAVKSVADKKSQQTANVEALARLQKEIADLAANTKTADSEKNAQIAAIKQNGDKQKSLEAAIAKMDQELAQAVKSVQGAQEKMKNAAAQLTKRQAELKAAQTALTTATQQTEAAKQKEATAKADATKATAAATSTAAALKTSEEQLVSATDADKEALTQQVAENRKAADAAKIAADQATSLAAAATAEVAKLTKAAEAQAAAAKRLEQQVAADDAEVKKQTAESQRLDGERQQKAAAVAKSKADLDGVKKVIVAAQAKQKQLESAIAGYAKETQQRQAAIKQAEEAKAKLTTELAELEKQQGERAAAVEATKKSLAAAESTLTKLKAEAAAYAAQPQQVSADAPPETQVSEVAK